MATPAWPKYLLDLSYDEWCDLILQKGGKRENARWIYSEWMRRNRKQPEAFQGRVPRFLIDELHADGLLHRTPIKAVEVFPSQDGSTKFMCEMERGGQVECVAMPFDGGRMTFCISSQVGCAMGCTFCATGTMGLQRNLSPAEIVAQVLLMRDHMFPQNRGGSFRINVVFMGMGEPLHNLPHVLAACRHLNHPQSLKIPENDMAISTSGLLPKIKQLAVADIRPNLMLSIGHPIHEKRSQLMPINQKHPIEDVLNYLESYPLRKRQRIMLSYVLIAGKNDGFEEAKAIASMAKRFRSLVNLIPMNEHDGSPGMREPNEGALAQFVDWLNEENVFVTIRRSRGRDVGAACGQLVRAV